MGFLGRTPARPCTADLTTAVAALVLCFSPWLDPAECLGNFQDKITQQAPSRQLPRRGDFLFFFLNFSYKNFRAYCLHFPSILSSLRFVKAAQLGQYGTNRYKSCAQTVCAAFSNSH